MPKLNTKRGARTSVGFIGGVITVAAGLDKNWKIMSDTMEVWDEEENRWKVSDVRLKYGRSSHGTVTVPAIWFPRCI